MNKAILVTGMHLLPPMMLGQLTRTAAAAGYDLAPAPMPCSFPEGERRFMLDPQKFVLDLPPKIAEEPFMPKTTPMERAHARQPWYAKLKRRRKHK